MMEMHPNNRIIVPILIVPTNVDDMTQETTVDLFFPVRCLEYCNR